MSNEGLIFLETDAPLRSVAEDVARVVGGTQSDVGPPGRIVIEVSVADGFYTVRDNRKVQPEYDALRYCVDVFGPQDPVELNERTLRLARRLVALRPDAHVVALDSNYEPIWTSGTPACGVDT